MLGLSIAGNQLLNGGRGDDGAALVVVLIVHVELDEVAISHSGGVKKREKVLIH